ncbi:MAG: glycerol-3-phosphate 1-O-acyltransferase PlsY [Firmicutes bacterium]|nr:glycerol-3-phosphate 1-O-acyltransferase PlsY [Bacillota bacterium]
MDKLLFVGAIVIAYFLGNISPSILLGRAMGIDIKKEGSGNAGTTNALRVLGKKAAIITLVVDIGKGVLAVLIGNAMAGPEAATYCALAAFAGHIWPAMFHFKGGKGVAVAFGGIVAINWQLGLICLAIVAVIVLLTRMVSAGSVSVAIVFPVLAYFMEPDFLYAGIAMAALLVYKHKGNIQRLLKGEENKLSFKKK